MESHKFVLQEHHMGESIHMDLRFDVGDHVMAFTLDSSEVPDMKKLLAKQKTDQPCCMLRMHGEIGSGGSLLIKDVGTYEMGVQTPDHMEFWLKGKKLDGRYILGKQYREYDAGNAEKKTKVWYFWRSEDPTPVVLFKNSSYVPPKGTSALSNDWEKLVPAALRWWDKNWEGEKALSVIKEIRSLLLKRNVLKDNTHVKELKSKKIENIELTARQISNLKLLSSDSNNSLSEIAGMIGCSKSTIMYQQKKMGLR